MLSLHEILRWLNIWKILTKFSVLIFPQVVEPADTSMLTKSKKFFFNFIWKFKNSNVTYVVLNVLP